MGRLVRDLMRRDFIQISPEEPLESVLQLMSMARVRALPVVRDGLLRGVVAHRDLAAAALGLAGGPASDAAVPVAAFVRPAEPVSPEAPLPEAARRMLGEELPCVVAAEEGEGGPRAVGLVTEGDLIREAYRRAPGREAPAG